MSGPDDLTAATGPVPALQGPLSRRTALRAAAGASLAAGALAATSVPALAATTRTAAGRDAAHHGAGAHEGAEHKNAEPIVVHLRDARTGEIDIFRGTSQTRVHDHALAALLIRASR